MLEFHFKSSLTILFILWYFMIQHWIFIIINIIYSIFIKNYLLPFWSINIIYCFRSAVFVVISFHQNQTMKRWNGSQLFFLNLFTKPVHSESFVIILNCIVCNNSSLEYPWSRSRDTITLSYRDDVTWWHRETIIS